MVNQVFAKIALKIFIFTKKLENIFGFRDCPTTLLDTDFDF